MAADAAARRAVTTAWNIAGLLEELAARGSSPAVIASGEQDVVTWDCATLAGNAVSLAGQLRERSFERGAPIALWAPNSPQWIAAALGILAAGGVLVPVDDQADPEQLDAVLARSGAVLLLTTEAHRMACAEILARHATEVWLLEEAIAGQGSQAPPGAFTTPVASAGADRAVLLWTSGTTGSAKAFFLTHGNIAVNVEALRALGVVGQGDRALLPLPLHHAYPLVVGVLLTLSSGTAIILPGGPTGPLIMKALADGEATAIVGVPRLYDALVSAIASRIEQRGVLARMVWRGLMRSAITVQRSTGFRLGALLFAPLRRAIARRLRYLVSGGARLDEDTEQMLEALGWTALSGYGLAETTSIFTGNSPGRWRAGSAGKPLAGQIRIAAADDDGIGEIELKGPSITAGYVDPAANAEAFTGDGWFRTGDLGYVDRDGFLFVTGRAKEILVLGGGRKVNPEDLERIYGAAPEIRELAVMEDHGALVALVHPDPAKLRDRGTMNVRDGVRVVLGERAHGLPSYERLSGFALTDQPLPRTRLGKYQRFLLPDLYAKALAGGPQRAAHMLDAADLALLQDPTAASVWALLRERFPDEAIDLDVDPRLDLNLNSFAWMELGLALEARVGVHLTEADIAEVETLRDLVRLCTARRAGAARPAETTALATDTERWLAPTGVLLVAAGFVLYGLNWLVMRLCFRLRVSGLHHVPAAGPYVIAPNHLSDLDGLVIAAALSPSRVRRAYWAGDIVRLFFNRLTQTFCRAAHIFPVDERYPDAAVVTAVRVLQSGNAQIWFSEGWRSPDGNVQRFLPGIGQLLLRTGAPAVPAWIGGTFEALPRSRRMPRLHRVTLTFGPAVAVEELRTKGVGRSDEERIADALRSRVVSLGRRCGAAVVEQTA